MRFDLLVSVLGGAALLTACGRSGDITAPNASADSPVVVTVSPANATVGVNPAQPIVMNFDRPMMPGMEALVVLHEGTVTGPVVTGTAAWSSNRSILTFTPSVPLKSLTKYVVHMSPGLMSSTGYPINLAACEPLGGQYVTTGMMGFTQGAGMMNGSWGPGMMGNGWRAADGTYGMVFTFTTA